MDTNQGQRNQDEILAVLNNTRNFNDTYLEVLRKLRKMLLLEARAVYKFNDRFDSQWRHKLQYQNPKRMFIDIIIIIIFSILERQATGIFDSGLKDCLWWDILLFTTLNNYFLKRHPICSCSGDRVLLTN
jgi:hypothetical protein